jgi:plastocyanin
MKSKMLVVAGAAGLAAVTLPATAATKPAPTVRLQASDFRFCPASAPACAPNDDGSITVRAGTRVTWVYADHACDAVVPCPGHNVVFANGRGSTKFVRTQGAVIFSGVFNHPGRYSYWCTAHKSFGMTGTVIVKR